MFGPLAEVVGTKVDIIDGSSVEEVLGAASRRYGDAFTQLLPTCQVWVNGEVAALDAGLEEADEVAVLPPVSGG